MLKNKLDYKLLNIVLILLIVFLINETGIYFKEIIVKTLDLITPFLFSFFLAYFVYPYKLVLEKKLPKWLSIIIIISLILFIISLSIYFIVNIFINEISVLLPKLSNLLNNKELNKYVSNLAINTFNTSISITSKLLIVIGSFIYFLIDMDKIKKIISNIFINNKKIYNYIIILDKEISKYLSGLGEVIIITLIEYTLGYTIISHPNALLLGFLSSIANLIPSFGGILVNIIGIATAYIIGPKMMIKTIIMSIILSFIDSYLINPAIYGKTNKIHPLITIISVYICGSIFGIIGILFSFPLTIFIITTIKYFKKDLKISIKKVKNNN